MIGDHDVELHGRRRKDVVPGQCDCGGHIQRLLNHRQSRRFHHSDGVVLPAWNAIAEKKYDQNVWEREG